MRPMILFLLLSTTVYAKEKTPPPKTAPSATALPDRVEKTKLLEFRLLASEVQSLEAQLELGRRVLEEKKRAYNKMSQDLQQEFKFTENDGLAKDGVITRLPPKKDQQEKP